MNESTGRRRFLLSTLLAGAGVLLPGYVHGFAAAESRTERSGKTAEEAMGISPVEDLMREHGLLRRVLLIYEAVDRRHLANDLQMQALGAAAAIIKSFIEDYHEKQEEDDLFPHFEKAGKEVELVHTLKAQHEAGRKVTRHIQAIAASGTPDRKARGELSVLIHAFIRMYRPHAAREDTVLFPALSSVISPAEYKELGDKFEEREHRLFGEKGFEHFVNKVAAIEKALGIYELARFTPKV